MDNTGNPPENNHADEQIPTSAYDEDSQRGGETFVQQDLGSRMPQYRGRVTGRPDEKTPDQRDKIRHHYANPISAVKPLSSFAGQVPHKQEYLIPGLIPEGQFFMVSGKPGCGKSMLMLQAAICLSTGIDFLGVSLSDAPCLYVSCEDDEKALHERVHNVCSGMGIEMDMLDQLMMLDGVAYHDTTMVAGFVNHNAGKNEQPFTVRRNDFFHELAATVRTENIKFVVLDGLSNVYSGDKMNDELAQAVVREFQAFCRENAVTMVAIMHPSAAQEASGAYGYGSVKWQGTVRLQWNMKTTEDDFGNKKAELKVGKSNLRGVRNWKMTQHEEHGHFEPIDPPKRKDTVDRIAEDSKLKTGAAMILGLVLERLDDGRISSYQKGAKTNPIAQMVIQQPDWSALGNREFWAAAMERVLDDGDLVAELVLNAKGEERAALIPPGMELSCVTDGQYITQEENKHRKMQTLV